MEKNRKLSYILEKRGGIKSIDGLFCLVSKLIDKEKAIIKVDLSKKILDPIFKEKGYIKFRDHKSSFIECYWVNALITLNLLLSQQKYFAEEKYGIRYIKLKEAIEFVYTDNKKLDLIIKYKYPDHGTQRRSEVLYKEEKNLVEFIKLHTESKLVNQITCDFK